MELKHYLFFLSEKYLTPKVLLSKIASKKDVFIFSAIKIQAENFMFLPFYHFPRKFTQKNLPSNNLVSKFC